MASKSDISAAYTKADQAVKKQYETAKNAVATAPNAIPADYAALNDSVMNKRTLFAIGNNASGNATQDAGYTNTNRMRSEAALSADVAKNIKQQAEADAARALNAQLLGYQADIAANEYLAGSAISGAAAIEQQRQFDASMSMAQQEAAEQQRQFDESMAMARQEAETAQKQYAAETAYNQAMAELELYGKVMTESAAAILGVPVGTTSLEWQKYIAKLDAAEAAARKGGGREPEYGDPEPAPKGNAGVAPGALQTNGYKASSAKSDRATGNAGVVPGAANPSFYTNEKSGYDAWQAAEAYKKNQKTTGRKTGNQGVVPK